MRVTALKSLVAREALDGIGNEAIVVTVRTIAGQEGRAATSLPVEAGVTLADTLAFLNTAVAAKLKGHDVTLQSKIDTLLLAALAKGKGAPLPRQATRVVSEAIARVGAKAMGRELTGHLRYYAPFSGPGWAMPIPVFKMLTHGNGEFRSLALAMHPFTPTGRRREVPQLASRARAVFQEVAAGLRAAQRPLEIAIDGTYVIHQASLAFALETLLQAVRRAGLKRRDVKLVVDVGAQHAADVTVPAVTLGGDMVREAELLHAYRRLVKQYPVAVIENGFSPEALTAWTDARQRLHGGGVHLYGEELVGMDEQRFMAAAAAGAVDGVTLRLDHVATVTQALQLAVKAKGANLPRLVAVAATETVDDFVVDFAVAVGAEYLKVGGFARGEHTAKLNRLLELEALYQR